MTELRASSDDLRPLTALDDGSGPNLLVVHPGGGDATTWNGVTRHSESAWAAALVASTRSGASATVPTA
ncbi:hypothetical protein [Streptomyces sp. NBC_01435]|uniref:hypothetical protein n=1 Tax=Streptomyces sp. NBC_01435 TaxID=2903865 RepID=UPI002E36C8B9|nr:hypothetical protein [Streptomyces sp. NBC_01435]